jgi:hypothetical protein
MNSTSIGISWPTGSTNETTIPQGLSVWSAYGNN